MIVEAASLPSAKTRYQQKSCKRVAVVLSAFGDDSADETHQRVFCVAGVVGSESDWQHVEEQWRSRLGCRVFHATDCESDRKDFRHFDHDDNQKLYKDLTNIVANSRLMSYAHAIDLAALRRVFHDGMPPWDSQFYFCFIRVLTSCAHLGYLSLPQEPVRFTFDERKESKYNSTELYRYARNAGDWQLSDFLSDEIAFAVRSTIGIQVADLIARESMKEADRLIAEGRHVRESMKVLNRSMRLRASVYGDGYLRGMREAVEKLDVGQMADYEAFLKAKRLDADNISNRIKWLVYSDLKAGRLKGDD